MQGMTVQVLTELETARACLARAVARLVPAQKILNDELQVSIEPTASNPTIKVVTENGFTIERACERDASPTDSASGCHFVVRKPDDEERRATVIFGEAAIRLVQSSWSTPLPLNGPFWLARAERYLVTYLWQKNDLPPNGKLTIDQL